MAKCLADDIIRPGHLSDEFCCDFLSEHFPSTSDRFDDCEIIVFDVSNQPAKPKLNLSEDSVAARDCVGESGAIDSGCIVFQFSHSPEYPVNV